jgi:uncharacterized membrane protein
MMLAGRSAAKLGTGRVLYFTFQIIRANLLGFSALSLIPAGSVVVMRYFEAALPGQDMFTNPALALSVAAYVICGSFQTAVISKAIVPDDTGHLPSLADGISAVARDFAALSAIALVSFVLFIAGYMLFILPGLFIGAILAVVLPVRVLERTGVIRTFVRSAQLTRGNRWPIFGLLLAYFVITVVCEVAVNVMSGDPTFAGYSGETRSAGPVSLIGSTLIEFAMSLVSSTATAVVYIELRHIKDGPGPTALASVFD